jgi:hypothetical protein
MKNLITAIAILFTVNASSQAITDTGALRSYINTVIIPNGTRAITGAQMNRVLNGFLNSDYPLWRQRVDSIWKVGNVFYYRKGGVTWNFLFPTGSGDSTLFATLYRLDTAKANIRGQIPGLARSAISLTTTGTSGAATYNNSSGILNVPQYNPGWGFTGNSGTNPISNYVGTSDNTAFRMAVNGKVMIRFPTTYNGIEIMDSATVGTNPNFFLNIMGSKFNIQDRWASPWLVYTSPGSGPQLTLTTTTTFTNPVYATSLSRGGATGSGVNIWSIDGGGSIKNTVATQKHWTLGTVINYALNPTFPSNQYGAVHTFYDSTIFPVAPFNEVTRNYTLYSRPTHINTTDSAYFIYYNPIFLSTPSEHVAMALGAGRVGIGTLSPNNSAALEVASTNKGFLPPRMTTAQRDAIASPATGITLFCTDCNANDASTGVMQTYNGTTWKNYW